MVTKIKHRMEMADMCCQGVSTYGSCTDDFRKSCTTQLRELLGELQDDLFKFDPDFIAFWEIMEVFNKARPHLEYRP